MFCVSECYEVKAEVWLIYLNYMELKLIKMSNVLSV